MIGEIKIVGMGRLMLDALGRRTLERAPEPPLDVPAFDGEGDDTGALQGVYLFNARAVHELAPKNARVLDLGCGPGNFAAFLARCRPDVTVVGLDLDPQMLDRARRNADRAGVADRVTFLAGDMTDFVRTAGERFDLVTSLFALHHLPDASALAACAALMARLVRSGAAVWLFDHARPRRRSTAERFPRVMTPDAPAGFNRASTDSLIAAWTFEEMSSALATISPPMSRELARWLPFYQVHWSGEEARDFRPWVEPTELSERARRDAMGLAGLFPALRRRMAAASGGRRS